MARNRNFDGIMNRAARLKVDVFVNDLHDELEIAYYKNWKLGKKYNFHGCDVQSSPEASKRQFDKLHGLLFLIYDIAIHRQNMQLPESERCDPQKYNQTQDKDGNVCDKDKFSLKKAIEYEPYLSYLVKALQGKVDERSKVDGVDAHANVKKIFKGING